jgi:hypothetical protein
MSNLSLSKMVSRRLVSAGGSYQMGHRTISTINLLGKYWTGKDEDSTNLDYS